MQKSTSAEETLQAKQEYERMAKENGITINAYHFDNGIFATEMWKKTADQRIKR